MEQISKMSNEIGVLAVTVQHDGLVTHLSMNRPDKLNAFNEGLVEGLLSGINDAIKNESRLLVITGEGRAFSAGFDLSDLDQQSDGDLVLRFIRIETMLQALNNAPMMTIALVHGRCFGAAADMVCVCDKRVAEPDTTFRFPGLNFDVVLGTKRLAHLVGGDNARDILETSKVFNIDEAKKYGIVQHVAQQDEWPDLISINAVTANQLSPSAQLGMLRGTRATSSDIDLASLARSVSQPGLGNRIKAYLKAMQTK